MSERDHSHDDEINLEVHHEESDVNVRGILWFVGIFIVFTIVTFLGVWGLFEVFKAMEQKKTGAKLTLVEGGERRLPPEPRLQPFPPTLQQYPGEDRNLIPRTPPADMAEMRAREHRQLTTWGWVDQSAGVVRMPVDQAMQIALQRGFAVRQPGVPAGEAVPAPVVTSPLQPGLPDPGADGSVRPADGSASTPAVQPPAPAGAGIQ